MNDSKISKQYTFPIDHIFFADGDQPGFFTVKGFLGRGGQGEVYKVHGPGPDGRFGDYAVKFYHPQLAEKIDMGRFCENLSDNIKMGIPQLSSGDSATQFIWPISLIREEKGSFGYLMPLFPEGYEPLKNVILQSRLDIMTNSRIPLRWKSWFTAVTAALNIVRAFEILHSKGLSYQDLNEGGVIIDMSSGDVRICDCDNVAPDRMNLGILGVMNYMAPEVVCHETAPNRHTDEYSLAVILFRLFLHGHPMEGSRSRDLHNDENLSRSKADEIIFGKEPHYCLASQNNQNPPDPSHNGDVVKLSHTFPMVLMDAFERVFTDGVRDPSKRLTATEWRRVLLQVRDSLVLVQGKEQFYGIRTEKKLPAECRTLVYSDGRRVLCMPNKILYRYHIDNYGTDYKTPIARIIPTKDPSLIGLHNASGETILVSKDGNKGEYDDNSNMPLLPGTKMKWGNVNISVE